MANAAKETKEFYEPEDDGIYNIAVSGDGTWRRRGYTSAYGVITALSTLTGKVLDMEIMLKECRECMVWEVEKEQQSFRTGGMVTNISVKQIVLVLLALWMHLACFPYSSVLWKPTVSVTLNF